MISLNLQNSMRERYRRDNPGWQPATDVYAGIVREYLRPDDQLLDLGCGRGGLPEQLNHPLGRIFGVDPDFHSLDQHRLAMVDPPLLRINALSQALPFAAGSFDLVIASWVLEHLAEPRADFQAIGQMLNPGSYFIFITPNKEHPLIGLNRWISRVSGMQDQLVRRLYGRHSVDTFPAHYKANTTVDLQNLAETGQMALIRLITVTDPSYLAFKPALYRFSCWLESRLPPSRHVHLVGCMQRTN